MSFLETLQKGMKFFMNKNTLFVILALIVFIALGYYGYKSYVEPKLNPKYLANREFNETVEETEEGNIGVKQEAELFFFHTVWCPHCKKAMPVMEELKANYDNKVINNTKLYIKFVDCDENEELADKFDVEGYPTIKLVKDNQVIEYDAKPEKDTLIEFLTTTLH